MEINKEQNKNNLSWIIISLTTLILLVYFAFLGFLPNIWLWIIIFFFLLFSEIFIFCLTKKLHNNAKTKEHEDLCESRRNIKILASTLEILLYTFLFTFHQIFFIIGWLVVKAIWNYPKSSESEKEKDELQIEAAAFAIFRIGVILSLVLAFIASLIIMKTVFKDTSFYESVLNIFQIKPPQN